MADPSVEIQRKLMGLTYLTPDLIAQRLEAEGITGSHSGYQCPIANYLKPVIAPDAFLYVGALADVWYRKKESHRAHQIRLPVSVQEFIKEFDRGKYPELYAPSEDDLTLGEIDV